MINNKKCSSCKQILSMDSFHKAASSKDGYHCICKICNNKRSKKYYLKTREKRLKNKITDMLTVTANLGRNLL